MKKVIKKVKIDPSRMDHQQMAAMIDKAMKDMSDGVFDEFQIECKEPIDENIVDAEIIPDEEDVVPDDDCGNAGEEANDEEE